MALLSALARRPAGLGARDGKLSPCPGTPNCVCSQDTPSPRHAIDPLTFDDGPDEAWERLKGILTAWPRTRIVTDGDSYLHAECASQVFRFVDDVECVLDRNAKVIHIRSASRAGRSDLGINRRRVEAIRQAFQER
jgi:uncharacterized protein (DUF1499 family)